MKKTFFYDPWTRFLERLWDDYWSKAEYIDQTIKEHAAFEVRLRKIHSEASIDEVRGLPWLRLNDGTRILVPVAGADDYPLKSGGVWTPFGINFPYIGNAADNFAFGAAFTTPFNQFRDLKLTGASTTTGASPCIVVCRTLDLNGQTMSNSVAASGSAGAATPASGWGGLSAGTLTVCTAAIAPSATVPYDAYENLFALGGNSGGNNVAGSNGVAASSANLIAALSMFYMMIGCVGGGGGGGGSSSTTAGASRTGGRRGCQGTAGTAGAGGAGGSGVGGGGGGGGGPTAGAGTATAGGNAGGILIVICDQIIGTTGTIHCDGLNASNVSVTNAGGGGGGGGGIALVYARDVQVAPTVRAAGGTGGTAGGGASGKAGGNGLAGLAQLIPG